MCVMVEIGKGVRLIEESYADFYDSVMDVFERGGKVIYADYIDRGVYNNYYLELKDALEIGSMGRDRYFWCVDESEGKPRVVIMNRV